MLHVNVDSLKHAFRVAGYHNTTTLPILDFVVIEPGRLTMTNLETAQTHHLDAQGTGSYLLPAENAKKLFQAFAADLSIESVMISFDDGKEEPWRRRVDAWGFTVISPTVGTFEARYGVPSLDQYPDVRHAQNFQFTIDTFEDMPEHVQKILTRGKAELGHIALAEGTITVATDTMTISHHLDAQEYTEIAARLKSSQQETLEHHGAQGGRADIVNMNTGQQPKPPSDLQRMTHLSDDCRAIVRWFSQQPESTFVDDIAPINVVCEQGLIKITQYYDGLADPQVLFYDTGQEVFALTYYVEVDDRTVNAPDILFIEQWLETMFDAAQVMPRQFPPYNQLAA